MLPRLRPALTDIAVELNCADYSLTATVAPGAAEYVTRQLGGVRIQPYRFASLDDKQVILDQVKADRVVETQLALPDSGLVATTPADQRCSLSCRRRSECRQPTSPAEPPGAGS